MSNTQLLCTFTKSSKLDEILYDIQKCYTLAFNKIYVLENCEDNTEYICSYNIVSDIQINECHIPRNTISVHRKRESCTIYTINALNYVITLLNDGNMDKRFSVPWDNYKNRILVTNSEGLKVIHTKLYKIINII